MTAPRVVVVMSVLWITTQAQALERTQTLSALALPPSSAVQALSKQGLAGYKNLVDLAFDETQTINTQWKSLAMLSELGGVHSLPQLERAISSPQWYHRNAALLSLPKVSKPKAIQWARLLIHDPSLIVRTSAVQTLKTLKDERSAELLWVQLNHPQNFRRGKSLWVRRRIVEALAEFARKGDEAKLVAVLNDKDLSLHKPAIRGLERLANKQLGQPTDPVALKRLQWQKWWQARADSVKSL